jgi:hypothetical protein
MSYSELAYVVEPAGVDDSVQVDEVSDHERGCVRGPIRSLMSALLFDGVIACLNYAGVSGKSGRQKFREAFNWIATKGDDYIFSFDNVCQCLGLDPEAFRKGLMRACSLQRSDSKKARRTF